MFRNKTKDKLSAFFRKNGFYLVLSVCLLGVGVGAFFGIGTSGDSEETPKATEPPEGEQVQAIVTPKPTNAVMAPSPTLSATPTEEVRQTVKNARVTLAMPLEGEIIKAFSGETLVYNPTLNMWMTHNGIDIAGKEGAEVKAALAGVIQEVKHDDSKGLMVTIDHGGNGCTVYAGLAESSVKAGDKINAGQTVGTVGTPPCESVQGAHLHFEYLVKEEYMDPVEYLG